MPIFCRDGGVCSGREVIGMAVIVVVDDEELVRDLECD
jgi:hypothetical protein